MWVTKSREIFSITISIVSCWDNYVTDDRGTGIVHCAPAFGDDDYRLCTENQINVPIKVCFSTSNIF